ncbi:ABC transporter ATP-binding protein [Mycolicibacterium sp. BiH015]|uniref:ABC transporter ATP-binding protein n=1 Tax=Mycolicibacterium sp. BiH015 TaxID=3018808 RepID=UPI0022DFE946|nr:ABC transporter ATP-binding protein [Mycolicibacterium sp. BiH015]MDA2891249.1 ABC transporter ATP-binding protein [Mycolicibacterium sp. BiH015]
MPPKVALGYVLRSVALLRPLRGLVALSILLGLVVTALPFVTPAVWGPIIEILGRVASQQGTGGLQGVWDASGPRISRPDGSSSGPVLSFAAWLAVWAASLVLSQVLGFVRAWVDAQVDWKLLTEIRQRVHDHLQSLSLDFFTGARSGALMQRVQVEAAGVQKLLTDCIIPPGIDAIVLVIALAYLFTLSWQMTVVSFVLAPLALLVLRFVGRRLQTTTRQIMTSSRHLGGELEETITGISDIQVFHAERRRSERFREASSAAAKNSAMMVVWLQASSRSTQIFVALSTALVLIVGVAFSNTFGLTVNSLIVFVGFVPTMFAPAQRIIDAYTAYSSTIPNVVSTYELLDTKPSIVEHPQARTVGEVHGNIVFEDVVFGYGGRQKVLDGVSFAIREGETVALVGQIGSGKSTIFNLLLRFLDPERGRIELDGHDIRELSLESLREQVSKLSQFPFFLKDSIRENIRLAKHNATDDEVEEACRLAHVHSVIVDPAKLERGYDTVVDVQVPSGGQKRLIALARCLLRKPEVLLLDEPTENLDADQRVRVSRVIREYACDRTVLVISHDMDFIAGVADRIIVLDGGRVAAQGTHQELLAEGGLYKKLYEAQDSSSPA